MKSDLSKVLSILPNLTSEEREQVRVKLLMLGAVSSGPSTLTSSKDGLADMVLSAISEVLSEKKSDFSTGSMIRKRINRKEFLEKVETLRSFFDEAGDTKVTRQAFIRLCAELLYNQMSERNMPVNAATLARHIHRIPSVVNTQFPGYAKAGLLRMIIRERGSDDVRQ